MLEGVLARVLALIFGNFLLAWHAPGQAANSENTNGKSIISFCGSQAIRAFFTHTEKENDI